MFAALLGLLGLVILAAGALSGIFEKVGLPLVALFLGLGTVLGPHGLGLVSFDADSPILGMVATLSLVLVLFTDAVSVDKAEVRRHLKLALVVLGPGTIITTLLLMGAARWLLGLSWPAAAILGAALASTDPVMVRGLLRQRGIPPAARTALRMESGLNDIVVLPVVLVGMALLAARGPSASIAGDMGRVAGSVFLLGPLAGILVGWISVRVMVAVRSRFGMRRDYESLYVLAVAFSAYAAAELMHASGFMATFAAGLTISLLDVELCDCFRDYGEATAEMLLLFAFVAFGTTLIWTGLDVMAPAGLAFAVVAVLGRSVVLAIALPRASLDPASRKIITWFGPRALSSLLLVLLPVFAGIDGAMYLVPYAALAVLLSIGVHGFMLWFYAQRHGGPADRRIGGGAIAEDGLRISLEEVAALEAAGEPVRMLDVRAERAWNDAETKLAGAIRVDPDHPVESAAEQALPKHDWLIGYCA